MPGPADTTTATQPPNVFQRLAQGSDSTPAPAAQTGQGNIFRQLADGTYKDPNAQPDVDPEQEASNTRQMLVSGLTGMPTPVMTEQDKQQFAQGKVAGAISVPAIAATYLGAHAALSAGIPALTKALTGGVVALGTWAEEHPVASKIIWHAIGNAIKGSAIGAGAAITGKVIRSFPD